MKLELEIKKALILRTGSGPDRVCLETHIVSPFETDDNISLEFSVPRGMGPDVLKHRFAIHDFVVEEVIRTKTNFSRTPE